MREFHIGDILSITTERLVSPRLIEGVYDILNYMTGDNLMTHQLPRASRHCAPYLYSDSTRSCARLRLRRSTARHGAAGWTPRSLPTVRRCR